MNKCYTILSYNPFVFLTAISKDNSLDILKDDYDYIKDNGLDDVVVTEEFKPIVADIDLYETIDHYMQEKGLDRLVIRSVGAKEYTRLYYNCNKWYANDLYIPYPTYCPDRDTIIDYARHHLDDFTTAISSATDLAFKNYMDNSMGAIETKLSTEPSTDEDIIGYVLLPIKIEKTKILSFNQTRENEE